MIGVYCLDVPVLSTSLMLLGVPVCARSIIGQRMHHPEVQSARCTVTF